MNMDWLGFSLVFLAGVLWSGLAMVVSSAGRRGCGMDVVQPASAVFVLVVGLLLKVLGIGEAAGLTSGCEWLPRAAWLAAFLVALAGLGNYLMLIYAQRGMGSGPAGVVWAFTQSSLMWPFVAGMLLFGEIPTWQRLSGIGLIVTSLVLFSRVRGETRLSTGRVGMGWLPYALLAFALSGFAQTAASLPSFLGLAGMRPLERSLLLNGGIVLSALVAGLCRWRVPEVNRVAVVHALVFGSLNMISQVLMYVGMDRLAKSSSVGIGYPVAQGVSIGVFFACQNRRAAVPTIGLVGLAALLLGIVLCGLG